MQLPARFGKYELLELSSQGHVDLYRARRFPQGKEVTIEILDSESPEAKSRFLQTARVMARSRHESVAMVTEVGEIEGRAYAVLEELPGEDIVHVRKENRFGSVREALKAAAKVAGGFSHLERQGVRIGEFLPQTIQIDFDGRVKVINAGFEPVNGAMGTFGSLLYELLEAPGETPVAASELAAQCMADDPAARPKNFAEIFARLQALIAPQLVRQPRNPGKSLVRLSVIVYGLVLLTTALAVVTWYFYQPPAEIPGMVYIPAGTFLEGPENHPAKLKGFYIDLTEVTNAEYSDFCRISGCAIPVEASNLPVVNITITEARAYAHWKHERLPTPLEWERAARGTAGSPFPWGDKRDSELANVADNPNFQQHAIMPARSFRGYPAFQMAGNAWEIVDSEATPTQAEIAQFASVLTPPLTENDSWITLRGGSYQEPLIAMYESKSIPARYAANNIGFRCVKDR